MVRGIDEVSLKSGSNFEIEDKSSEMLMVSESPRGVSDNQGVNQLMNIIRNFGGGDTTKLFGSKDSLNQQSERTIFDMLHKAEANFINEVSMK